MLWDQTLLRRGVLDTTLCDKVCQWLAAGPWFSPGSLVSSINKTDRHNITEILLKVALNTINQTNTSYSTLWTIFFANFHQCMPWGNIFWYDRSDILCSRRGNIASVLFQILINSVFFFLTQETLTQIYAMEENIFWCSRSDIATVSEID